ncbi:prenyltransferase/squalene oxidase repeat-containing protein [Streptomyces sp. NPDC015220]|uniref:prenyltransferase/squalene oxidase repeat-containing protein n=1 Tax=Streptomyces sp. NPDC015220 TaxID=3364947 RepID=UPI0036FF0599
MHTALAAARAALADQQDKEGGWTADATADGIWCTAVDVLLHHLLDAVDPGRSSEQRARIVLGQNDDGGFALRADGPSDLSCTVLSHVALQLTGHAEDRERLDRAARFARRHGGVDAAGAEPARFWLAFTGAVAWDATVPLFPELLLLPRASGAVTRPGPAARAVAAAVGVLGSVRPVRELPIDTAPLHVPRSTRPALRAAATTAVLRAAHVLGRRSPGPLRRKALREAEHVLLNGLGADGTWSEDPSAAAVCVLALWALGHSTRHPAVGAALHPAGRDGTGRVPALPATAADTALALRALAAAGDRAGCDPVVDRAVDRLLPHLSDLTGISAGPGAPAPAPDVEGTALSLTALHRIGAPLSREAGAAVARGVRWLLERQSANGGWSRHGVRHRSLPGQRALTGPGLVEPPSPVATAHVMEALCAEGYAWHPCVRRALRLLLADQDIEGFWEDRRGGRLHATTEVLLALDAAGVGAGHLAVEGAMEWMYQRQNQDGGWGDEAEPAPGTARRASGPSTVAQTARCVLAAHTTGLLDAPRVDAAVAFLLRHQGEDGGWARPAARTASAPAGAHPPPDVRTDAYALWAIALHARHAESASRADSVPGGDLPGAAGPTGRSRLVPSTAVSAEQEERR